MAARRGAHIIARVTQHPDAWPAESAAVHLADTLTALGSRLGLEVDPVAAASMARRALSPEEWPDRSKLADALEAAGQTSGLSFERAELTAAEAFDTAAVPFVLFTAPGQSDPYVCVLERARSRVRVDGAGWLRRDAFARKVSPDAGARLSAASASPMAPWAALGHDDASPPTALHRVTALLKLERDDLAVVAVYALGVGVLSLATPVAVQATVNTIASASLAQPLVVLSLLLFAALGGAAALRLLQAVAIELIERRLFVRTALDFAWRFPRLAPSERDSRFGPHVANRFFEVSTLQKTAAALLTDGVAVTLQAALGLTLMAFYHPYLLAFGLVLVVGVGLIVVAPWQAGLKSAIDESTAKYAVAEWLEELSRVPVVFQGQAALAFATTGAESRTRAWLLARQRHFRVLLGQTGSALALHVIASTVLLAVGGALVMRSELTLGQLVAAELVVTSVTDALVKLGKLLDKGYDFTVSLKKISGVVDLPLETLASGQRLPSGAGGKRVRVAALQAADGPPLDFEVPGGGRVAVIDPEQSHRAVLAEVLAGHRAPDSGSVELDGVDTRVADQQHLRGRVALVRAGTLFAGSVADNLALGRADIGDEAMRRALMKVGLLETVSALPDGLQTELTAHGSPLSPDAMAKLLVARALAAQPRLMVVEDFFEALSPGARELCVKALVASRDATLVAVCPDKRSALARACTRVGPGADA